MNGLEGPIRATCLEIALIGFLICQVSSRPPFQNVRENFGLLKLKIDRLCFSPSAYEAGRVKLLIERS